MSDPTERDLQQLRELRAAIIDAVDTYVESQQPDEVEQRVVVIALVEFAADLTVMMSSDLKLFLQLAAATFKNALHAARETDPAKH